MALKHKIDYGFNGFQTPVVPRAPRSLRRRGSFKKEVTNGRNCAFELLATVAGKLLRECESLSSASSNETEGRHDQRNHGNELRTESHAHVSSEESTIMSELSSQKHNKYIMKESHDTECDVGMEQKFTVGNNDYSEKNGNNLKIAMCTNKKVYDYYHSKVNGESCGSKKDLVEKPPKAWGVEAVANEHGIKNTMGLHMKRSTVINSVNKSNATPDASFPRHRNDKNVGLGDDDENYYRCEQSSTKVKAFRPSLLVGDCRIRKTLTSKYWKVAPNLKEFDVHDSDRGTKRVSSNWKTFDSYEKFQRDRPFKKRKLFDKNYAVTTDGGEGMNGDQCASDAFLYANRAPSSIKGHQESIYAKGSPVRFIIKSFKVPELCIEVSETETVGSLKRTIMEAVEAILHGGLDIGVLLRGEKVKDDSRTLLQAGISHNDNTDVLGFTLEPVSIVPSPLCAEDPQFLVQCDKHQHLPRPQAPKLWDSGDSDESYDPFSSTKLVNHVETGYDLVPSATDSLTDKKLSESRALVPNPAMNVKALTAVRMNQKLKRSELVQRRTRRPFSVSEVEALVHAVEKLGTGRWRDVKLCAFDNANHRTYVDLKDKWKTLVHTAQISPQQRRGEPVPQELLDRVLAAHSYWSRYQTGTLNITEA